MLVLTYHGVHTSFDGARDDPIYSVSKHEFEKELDFLSTLEDTNIATFVRAGESGPKKVLILTFDDGLISAWEQIWPLLGEREINAVFFISPGLVGAPGYLKWKQILQMSEEGAEFGTHGYHHKKFSGLSTDELYREIAESKKVVEDRLGKEVVSMALPGGSTNPLALEMGRKAGYRFLATSRRFLNPLPPGFCIGRFPVKRRTPYWFFKATARMNPAALSLHRLLEVSKTGFKRSFPGWFNHLRGLKG